MKLVTTNEAEVNAWFSELKEALGLSEGTDRGRVLKAVRASVSEVATLKEEQNEVANHYGYKKWGNLLNHVRQSTAAAPVELPTAFEELPVLWEGPHVTLERKLRKSVQPAVVNFLKKHQDELESEPDFLAELVALFEDSKSPEEFEVELRDYTRRELAPEVAETEVEEPRVSWSELLTTLETHLRPHVASESDWERVRSFEGRPRTDEQLKDWEAKFQVERVTPREVAQLFEEAVFELAGFRPAQGGEPSEWLTLQVEGRLPQGEEFLDVLKQGLPTTREGWLEASPVTV